MHACPNQEILVYHSHKEHFKMRIETQGPSVFPTVSWSKVLESSLETQADKLGSHG